MRNVNRGTNSAHNFRSPLGVAGGDVAAGADLLLLPQPPAALLFGARLCMSMSVYAADIRILCLS